MKAKVSRGNGFRGALEYVLDAAKGAEIVGGVMSGSTPRELAREFSASRALRPDIKRPVWHCSLSLPPGERLSAKKWSAIAADFMQRMGFSDATQYVVVRHRDTKHSHVHIIASRVGLDGSVWLGKWEARRAIEATQGLEREHGLTLTPGLGSARAERRKLTDKEINMAIRTGKEPPRQQLQRILDEAIKDAPTALELAERLVAAGVGVRANIAKTGKMSGFSFGIDGIWFKGSSLGDKYKWSSLQKAGVTYDEARDRAGLERLSAAVADRGERAHAAAGREPDAERVTSVAGRASDTPVADDRTAADDLVRRAESDSSVRRDYSSAESSDRLDSVADHTAGDGSDRSASKAHRASGGNDLENRERSAENRNGNISTQARDTKYDRSHARSEDPVVLASGDANSGRNSQRGRSGDWAARFKRASAAKRNAAQGRNFGQNLGQSNGSRTKVPSSDIESVKRLDPTPYLTACGYEVKKEGRHYSVRLKGDELYRITRKNNGIYLWCDRYGNTGGDNIDLAREIEPGIKFAEAVYKLLGNPRVTQTPIQQIRRVPPTLPIPSQDDIKAGRAYLKNVRKISDDTIHYAEKQKFLRYCEGGILFVGYSADKKAMNVTKRSIVSAEKRDLRGSDKSYPPILPGDPAKVWIVEGGVDALALHDIAKRRGEMPPTVIVSGGAAIRSFLENPHVQELLKKADVTIALENEKDEETQRRTDALHQKQADRVYEITGKKPSFYRHDTCKDIAELNEKEQQRQKTHYRARTLERDRDYGMDFGM